MKLIKMIYVVACLTILATGCDSDDGEVLNTADVSVEFGQASVTVKETEEFVTVPVLVTDNAQRNGDIIVQITMKGNTGGFQLDKEVIVTTQTLRIPP